MLSKLRRVAGYIAVVHRETGWSWPKSFARIARAKQQAGIGARQYVDEQLYRLPESELLSGAARRNSRVSFVAKQRGVAYDEAREVMDRVQADHGITYAEFVEGGLWQYRTEQGLQRRIASRLEQERGHVEQVAHETGWSYDEAEAKMRRAKRKWPAVTFRKYATFNFHSMTDAEIEARVQQWISTAAEQRALVMRETGWTRAEVQAHMTRVQARYGIIAAYYICYRAWQLSDEQLDGYARQQLSSRLSSKYNTAEGVEAVHNKELFDARYEAFLNRKYWLNRADATFESFESFAEGLDEAFCKLVKSGGGVGAFTVALPRDRAALREVYDDLMQKPLLLVEEVLQQHPEIKEFYPRAVSSVRVVTIRHRGEAKILSMGIQFGHHHVTDNFTNDGMVADVDMETGTVLTDAVDKDGCVYEVHPVSGKRFKGFAVPNWDLVKQTAIAAMEVEPRLGYVGWDFAIGTERVSILEGNSMPDLALLQAAYAPQRIGKRYLFDPYLDDN